MDVELIPGGSDIDVDDSNRAEWARLTAEMVMLGRCRRGLAQAQGRAAPMARMAEAEESEGPQGAPTPILAAWPSHTH